VDYILALLKQDYNVNEISEKYINRYATIKGEDIPQDGSPRMGAEKAVVTIVEFTDFECPFCAKASKTVKKIVKSYPDYVAVIFKFFPLSEIHPTAMLAARAAYAAQKQNKFWQMHDLLFISQSNELTADKISVMAKGLGLDVTKFEEDLASDSALAAIKGDIALGKKLNVKGTPTFFVNGRIVENGAENLTDRINEEFLRHTFQK
jgi:protein-disulfide isomerase